MQSFQTLKSLEFLSDTTIVLASASPRRKEILESLGLPFTVIPSTFDENLDKKSFSSPSRYVQQTATLKARSMVEQLVNSPFPNTTLKKWLIISADTIVVQDDAILEKPKDEQDAIRMLKSLSGRKHKVMTAIVYLTINSQDAKHHCSEKKFVEETEVEFIELGDDMIQKYVETGESMLVYNYDCVIDERDKAGGYGIQGLARFFVKKIDGCYYNVVGFPAQRFLSTLIEIGAKGST